MLAQPARIAGRFAVGRNQATTNADPTSRVFVRHSQTQVVHLDASKIPDGVGLNQNDRERLIEKLDQAAGSYPTTTRRQHDRVEYHAINIPITITHPGGSVALFRVSARNISSGGISILYAGFIHPNAQCELQLRDLEGNTHTITGEVRGCRHVERRLHEVGIQFKERLDTAFFVSPDASVISPVAQDDTSAPIIGGMILVVGSSEDATCELRNWLQATTAVIIEEDAIGAAIDSLKRVACTAIFLNCGAVDDEPIGDVINRIRAIGFKGPIFGLASAGGVVPDDVIGPDGMLAVLSLPTTEAQLYELLEEAGKTFDLAASDAPIHSSLSMQSPKDKQAVRHFVALARQASEQLEQARAEEERERIVKICASLSKTAGGYGFPVIATSSKRILKLVCDAPASSDAVGVAIDDLIGLCRRLSEAPASAKAG